MVHNEIYHEKQNNVYVLLRNGHPSGCPFKTRLLIPTPAKSSVLSPGQQAMEFLPSIDNCNSNCPFFQYHEESNRLTLLCVPNSPMIVTQKFKEKTILSKV